MQLLLYKFSQGAVVEVLHMAFLFVLGRFEYYVNRQHFTARSHSKPTLKTTIRWKIPQSSISFVQKPMVAEMAMFSAVLPRSGHEVLSFKG